MLKHMNLVRMEDIQQQSAILPATLAPSALPVSTQSSTPPSTLSQKEVVSVSSLSAFSLLPTTSSLTRVIVYMSLTLIYSGLRGW